MFTQQYSPRAAYRFSLFRHSGARRVQPLWEESEWELKEKYPELQSPDDPVLDILALMELRQRAYDVFLKWHKDEFQSLPSDEDRQWFLEQVKALTTPASFFTWTGTETQEPLYHPLPVIQRKTEASETEIIEKASQLSAFLIQLQQEQSRQGVLITTRSGGGKTVACRQADLLFLGLQQHVAEEQKQQPSPAIIPVWMSLQHETALKQRIWPDFAGLTHHQKIKRIEEGTNAGSPDVLIELLVANAHKTLPTTDDELQSRQRAMLRQLHFGPSLIMFFDLNHTNELERELYTEAIIAFQKHPQLGKKHRCVVVYRGAGKGDRVIQRLLSNTDRHWPGFQEYDLKTIKDEQAIEYCGQIREFEQRLWKDPEAGLTKLINERFKRQKPDLVPCQQVLDGSEQQTRTLLQQLISRSRMAKSYQSDSKQTEEDNDSLISVPLLMHWVSLLEPQALSRIANLTHLYREIVSQHLRREYPQMGLHQDLIDLQIYQTGEAKNRKPVTGKMVTGMTRIALAILAQGAGTIIEVDEACELLEDPSEYPEDDSRDWRLKSSKMPSLAKSDYNHQEFTPEEAQTILRHGLFRQEGDQLRFAHDSLIYYFVGMALREFKKPGKPGVGSLLPETWAATIADILLQNPGRWLLPAEFLGGAMLLPPENGRLKGQPSQALRELVMRLVAYWPDIPRDEAIEFMEPVPKLVSRLCSTQPHDKVLQQVYQATNDHSRFAWEHPNLLLQEVMNRCRWFGAPGNEVEQWARQLDELVQEESHSIKAYPFQWLKKIHGKRISDTLTIEGAHSGPINSVAIFDDADGPKVISAGMDGNISISDPNTGEVERIINEAHEDSIRSIKLYKNIEGGIRVVSVGDDRRIVVSNPQTGTFNLVNHGAHGASVRCVTVYKSPTGPRVVSGGDDRRIVISNPQTGEVDNIVTGAHSNSIHSLSVYQTTNGPRIVSAGDDGQIVISNPRNGEVEQIIKGHQYPGGLFRKFSEQKYRYMGNSTQNSVFHTNTMIVCEGRDGPQIIAADNYFLYEKKIIVINPLNMKEDKILIQNNGYAISSLSIYEGPEGPMVVSASIGGQFVITNPRSRMVEETVSVNGLDNITSIAAYVGSEGLRLVSADNAGRIVVINPQTVETKESISEVHTDCIACVAIKETMNCSWIISGGRDNQIVIRDLKSFEVLQVLENAQVDSKHCIDMYVGPHGPRIISAGENHQFLILNPWNGEVTQILTNAHTSWIHCFAVNDNLEEPWIISGGRDSQIVISNYLTEEVIQTISGVHTFWIRAIGLYKGQNGLRIVSAGEDKRVVVTDPKSGEVECDFPEAHIDEICSIAIYEGPDVPLIVSAGWDRRIVICNPVTGQVEHIIIGAHTEAVKSVVVYEGIQGMQIVSMGDDGKINIWNLEDILTRNGKLLTRDHPNNTLFEQAQCLAIDQVNNRLICGVGKHLEVYEFVTH